MSVKDILDDKALVNPSVVMESGSSDGGAGFLVFLPQNSAKVSRKSWEGWATLLFSRLRVSWRKRLSCAAGES